MKKILVLVLLMALLINVTYADRPIGAAITVDSLKYEPYPAEAGSYMNIWIKMENYGTKTADDATFILEPQFPFSLDESETAERHVGQLVTGEEVVLEYKVRIDEDAIEGNNELEFKFTNDGNAWIIHTFDIFVNTHDTMLNTQEVIVEPSEVAPGEIVSISLMLKNMADSSIKDLRAELELTQRDVLTTGVVYSELPLSPISSTNILMAKRVGAGEQKVFSFNLRVDADAEPKVYRIPLVLTYSDELGNTTYEERSVIAVPVGKSPDIMVNIDNSDIYYANSQGDVLVGIYNIGVSKIKFLLLELKESEDYEILSTPKVYLGNVDSDDYETAEFQIYANVEDPLLELVLNYKDEYNNEQQNTVNLNMKTYSKRDAKKYGFIQSNTGSTITVVVLILALAGFIYFKKFRKKKKRR